MIRQDSLTIVSLAAVICGRGGDIENSFSSYNDCSKVKLRVCVDKKIWKSKEPVLSEGAR